jgi:hypothetical protein
MKTEAAGPPVPSSFRILHSSFCISRDRLTVVLAIAVFAALSATMAVKSDAFLEGDACTHFMYARAAFAAPYLLVNVWGRPICTALFAIPAHFSGRTACRLTSLGVAIAMALVCRSIARRQGWRWPALAVVFTFAQPLVFLHSFSELTELPFALLMSLAFLAYQGRRWFWMAVAVGLTPLSRPEGFGFVVLAAVALLLHGRARWWAVLGLPLLLWDLAGWRLYGCPGHWWHWLADNWPYAGDSLYDRGYLLKYVAMLPAVVGPLVFPATLIGIAICLHVRWRDAWRIVTTDHLGRCELLIAVLPLMVLVGHSVLTWLGKMGSNGEIRYMLVVAPFWALLSARGWEWTFERLGWHRPLAWAGVAAALPLITNRFYTVLPQRPMPDWVEAAEIADWYKQTQASAYPHIALAHPGLLYALDLSPTDGRLVDWKQSTIDAVPPDTLLVWDRVDSTYNADRRRKIPLEEIQRDGWVPLAPPAFLEAVPGAAGVGAGDWAFFHSSGGPPTTGSAGAAR